MVIWVTVISLILIVDLIRVYLLWQKNNKAAEVLIKRQKEIDYLNFLIDDGLSNNKSIEETFSSYLNTLKETVGWTYHSLFRLDEEKQVLPIRFTGYLPAWYMEELSVKMQVRVGDISIGRAVATKQPVTINAAKVDPRFQDAASLVNQTGYQSLTCCPMIGKLKTYGGFCTYSAFKNIFTLHDTQFFMVCANIYAVILEDKLLQDYLESSKSLST